MGRSVSTQHRAEHPVFTSSLHPHCNDVNSHYSTHFRNRKAETQSVLHRTVRGSYPDSLAPWPKLLAITLDCREGISTNPSCLLYYPPQTPCPPVPAGESPQSCLPVLQGGRPAQGREESTNNPTTL